MWTQQSEREIRQGYMRTRLSSAISRNGGGVWEHFQNVESCTNKPTSSPALSQSSSPEGRQAILPSGPVTELDPEYAIDLPVGYGRWSYPSVYVAEDRVLISHSYSYHDETGETVKQGANKLKVLPISWFYGGNDPKAESTLLQKIQALPPRP